MSDASKGDWEFVKSNLHSGRLSTSRTPENVNQCGLQSIQIGD